MLFSQCCIAIKNVIGYQCKKRWFYILIPVLFVSYFYWHVYDLSKNKHAVYDFSVGVDEYSYNKSLLTHNLILFDERNGVSNHKTAELAIAHVNFYLSEVRKICSPDSNNKQFISCANKILGKYFYYKPSDEVSTAYANGYSDCDLNSYLIMDAARNAKKEVNVVFSPGHAFVAFADSQGNSYFWETTGGHNTGHLANMQYPFYRKNTNPFYYTQKTMEDVKLIYPVLVLDAMPSQYQTTVIQSLSDDVRHTPLFANFYYEHKNPLTADDVRNLTGMIQTDFTSPEKKIILAKYYVSHGVPEKAKQMLSSIEYLDCGRSCLEYARHYLFGSQVLFIVDSMFRYYGVTLSTFDREFITNDAEWLFLAVFVMVFVVEAYHCGKKQWSHKR